MCVECIVLVTNFQNRQALEILRPQRLLTFNISYLKLRSLAKL